MQAITKRTVGGDAPLGFATQLSLYLTPPIEDLTLDKFEKYAQDRILVLKAIEEFKAKGLPRDVMNLKIKETVEQHLLMPDVTNKNTRLRLERSKDQFSHHILRIAYCRTEELRRWFLANECQLFRFRFEKETPSNVQNFLLEHNLKFPPVPQEDQIRLKEKLLRMQDCLRIPRGGTDDVSSSFYKVPFEEATELVGQRKVLMDGGFAYVHKQQLVSIVMGIFRTKLSRSLIAASKSWAHVQQDERLLPLLTSISKQYIGNDYSSGGVHGRMTLGDLDLNAKSSFPPCMRRAYEHIKEHHHMKHFGRMQFGLFLKGVGLGLEDALAWWRNEFTKGMPTEKFEKSYAYNIRHNYGKEGKRTDYTPYSCMKVIRETNGACEGAGCPFADAATKGEEPLKLLLRRTGVNAGAIDEMVKLSKDHHYQVACSRFFAAMHKGQDISITHPNQYFDESVKVLTGTTGAVNSEVKEEKPAASQDLLEPSSTPAAKPHAIPAQ